MVKRVSTSSRGVATVARFVVMTRAPYGPRHRETDLDEPEEVAAREVRHDDIPGSPKKKTAPNTTHAPTRARTHTVRVVAATSAGDAVTSGSTQNTRCPGTASL